jgi:hypothetical protein
LATAAADSPETFADAVLAIPVLRHINGRVAPEAVILPRGRCTRRSDDLEDAQRRRRRVHGEDTERPGLFGRHRYYGD